MDMTGKEILARIFLRHSWSEWPHGFMLEEREPLDNWSRMSNLWIFIERDGTVHRNKVIHWIYYATEIVAMLEQVGFSNIVVYGGLDGRPYDNEANRLIAISTK